MRNRLNGKVMSRFLMCIAALVCGISANAQTTVRGTVKDAAKGEAVGYATVAAMRDSLVVAAVASTADGVFDLRIKESGECRVEITAVGYSPFVTSIVADGKVHDLGEVALKEGVEVDAVVLTVQKPIVTADAEKLTYSVEDDPEAQSSTLEEIIRKVPQLTIDAEGKVLMNGQSDYKILVNGHQSSSMSRNFADIIKSMPASSIKRIEVITNPSMKYDAEGVGGVLNIITTKARFDGYSGSVNVAARNMFNRNWDTNNSANFTLQTGKFALSAGLYYSQAWADRDDTVRYDTHVENLTPDGGYKFLKGNGGYGYNYHSVYGNIQASYQIDSLNLVTAEVSAWEGRNRNRQHTNFGYFNSADSWLYGYDQSENARYAWMGVDAALNYEHTFRREGHTLTVSDNVSVVPPVVSSGVKTVFPTDGVTDVAQQNIGWWERESSVDNVLQIDYRNPITKRHTIEAGAKHSYDYNRLREMNTFEYADDATSYETSGISRLTRNILGVYFGYAYSVDKFSARAGGRLEGAWYGLNSEEDDKPEKYKSSLINFVPYVSLTYLPKQGHTLALSYTERLSRPGVYAMSPFVTEDLLSRDYGNPNLKTGVTHNMSLKYSFSDNKWSATVGALMMMSNNLVSNYTFLDSDGIFNSTYGNHGRMRMYGGESSMSFRPSGKFNLSLSVKAGWGRYTLPSQGIETAGWGVSQNLNMTVALWKGAKVSLSEYAILPEPRMGQRRDRWIVGTSVRLGQKLLKEKMEISVVVNDPHEKYSRYVQLEQTPTFIQRNTFDNWSRSIRLSVSYRFGKQGLYVKSTNKKVDDASDEVSGGSKGNAGGM